MADQVTHESLRAVGSTTHAQDATSSLTQGYQTFPAYMRTKSAPSLAQLQRTTYNHRMDNLDRGILDLLRQNARAGYGDIGSVVGLSASAVKRRVDRLVADGVIRGFTIQVDPAADGMSTEAYVELFCRGTVAPDELLRLLSAVPEVVDAGTVTGSADAIVHIRARDIPGLEAALEKVRRAPNVDHTRSAIVLSRLIQRGAD
ncbi:MAG: AsnC family transcriptional regulator [Cryobacterium sp.]|jgi:DNA-binding Lrp family transcriptional regulator|nr:AsnC family transcriptional regulator [Cryobacterium sp.]